MPLDSSPAAADVSVLAEVAGMVRDEARAERARGVPLKRAAPLIARRLGLSGARRVLAFLHGEVAEDDVRAVELEAVRRARRRTVRAIAADAAWAAEIEELKARIDAIEGREAGHGMGARNAARMVQVARQTPDQMV